MDVISAAIINERRVIENIGSSQEVYDN
ncbi:hypothetical protein BN77_p10948 [Rhizobium mesoamericanum STM3625]|uniref:Uncharacterized protein n=1 Tax=Rhizobium mesoamericanum STM3625 TaxID=1211777 RepID=K0PNZ0_9HYPH|nr:hypothetical protein BN77_p10948 [Rhizobium mesoamericanum STM3625]